MIKFECVLIIKDFITNETKTVVYNKGKLTNRLVEFKQDFAFNDINKLSLNREIVQAYVLIGNKPSINVKTSDEIEVIEKSLRYFVAEVYHGV